MGIVYSFFSVWFGSNDNITYENLVDCFSYIDGRSNGETAETQRQTHTQRERAREANNIWHYLSNMPPYIYIFLFLIYAPKTKAFVSMTRTFIEVFKSIDRSIIRKKRNDFQALPVPRLND
jgi:hypothetical protein